MAKIAILIGLALRINLIQTLRNLFRMPPFDELLECKRVKAAARNSQSF